MFLDLPTALVALIVVAIIAYIITVVHAATTRTLGGTSEIYQPEERLLAWPKWLSGLIGVLLVIWLLYQVRGILVPFILGAVIAYLLNPGITRLERRGWTRDRAILLVFGTFLVLLVVAVVLLVPKLTGEAQILLHRYAYYAEKTQKLLADLETRAVVWGRVIGLLPEQVRDAFTSLGQMAQRYAGAQLQTGVGLLNRSVVLVSLLIITPVVTFWILRDYKRLGRKLLGMLPEPRRAATAELLAEINKLVGSYLLGMAIMVLIVGCFAIIVLSIARVNFSVLLGMMTGVLYLIPYVGFPTAIIVIALTMAVTEHAIGSILIVLGALLAGNLAFDYVATPRVVGSRVGLHPLVVIFALLAGAALFKFVGMLLAVPTAGAIKVVLLRFWPELFAPDPPSAEAA
jgi:predicted PurR-regulated permease PerM